MAAGGSAESGRKARFFVRPTIGTGTFIPVKGIKSIDRSGSTGEEECTDFDSEGKREFLAGLSEATYEITMNDLHVPAGWINFEMVWAGMAWFCRGHPHFPIRE